LCRLILGKHFPGNPYQAGNYIANPQQIAVVRYYKLLMLDLKNAGNQDPIRLITVDLAPKY
jgi:hypothetical protein